MRLDGKRVIIIGGSSGIGLEQRDWPWLRAASVLIAGRSRNRLRKAAALDPTAANSGRRYLGQTSIETMFAAEKQIDHVFLPAANSLPGGGDVLEQTCVILNCCSIRCWSSTSSVR